LFDAEIVELLSSELVSNAIRYGGVGMVRLDMVLIRGDRLRVSVTDSGRGSTRPHLRHPGSDEEGGRGLLMVAEVAADWGVMERRGGGSVVWFEVEKAGGSVERRRHGRKRAAGRLLDWRGWFGGGKVRARTQADQPPPVVIPPAPLVFDDGPTLVLPRGWRPDKYPEFRVPPYAPRVVGQPQTRW